MPSSDKHSYRAYRLLIIPYVTTGFGQKSYTWLENGVSLSRQFVNTHYLPAVIPKLARQPSPKSSSKLSSRSHSRRTCVNKTTNETDIIALITDFDATRHTKIPLSFPNIPRNSPLSPRTSGNQNAGERSSLCGRA